MPPPARWTAHGRSDLIVQVVVAQHPPCARPHAAGPPLKPCSSRPRQTPADSGSDVAAGRSRGAFAPDPLQGGIPMRPLTFACASLAALALLSAPRSAPAATPEVITLSPGDTQATWQTPLIVGNTGEDPNNCIEDVNGTVRVEPSRLHRQATLQLLNDVTFCPNVTVSAPGAARVCEPSLRVDVRGNCYVGGIRGVPAGVDLWRFDLDPASPGYDPQLRNPTYLGQPDAFAAQDTSGGRDGGGDIDIATSFPTSALQTPVVTIVSLAAANISSAVSTDRGENFALSPAVANVPADDRQWSEAAGADTVYLFYRAPIPATGLFVQRSTDHGASYPMTALVSPTGTTPGYIDVDHANGYVYVSHMSSSAVFVSRSTD